MPAIWPNPTCMAGRLVSLAVVGAAASLGFFPQAACAQTAGAAASLAGAAPLAEAIGQLGHESFETRELAAAQLVAAGESARPALAAAAKHADLEIRLRCRHLLTTLDAIHAREERIAWETRLNDFVEDERVAEADPPLPGWRKFRDMVGGDRAARLLFAEMHRAEREVLALVDPKDAKEAEALAAEIRRRGEAISRTLPLRPPFRTPVTSGRGAALVFAATCAEKLPAKAASMLHSMLYQQDFRLAMSDPEQSVLLKKVLGAWVELERPGDNDFPYHKLTLAVQFDLKQGLGPALRVVKKAHERGPYLSQAVVAVARFGSEENLADLEPLLANTSNCYTVRINQTTYTTEVRDVALAALVHMTGQNPAEYGFDRLQKTQALFAPHSAGFANANAKGRVEALERWQRWKASQKK